MQDLADRGARIGGYPHSLGTRSDGLVFHYNKKHLASICTVDVACSVLHRQLQVRKGHQANGLESGKKGYCFGRARRFIYKLYSRCVLLTHSVHILEYYFAFQGGFFFKICLKRARGASKEPVITNQYSR